MPLLLTLHYTVLVWLSSVPADSLVAVSLQSIMIVTGVDVGGRSVTVWASAIVTLATVDQAVLAVAAEAVTMVARLHPAASMYSTDVRFCSHSVFSAFCRCIRDLAV